MPSQHSNILQTALNILVNSLEHYYMYVRPCNNTVTKSFKCSLLP